MKDFVETLKKKVEEKCNELDEIEFDVDWSTNEFWRGEKFDAVFFSLPASDTYYGNVAYDDQCEELKDYIMQECNVSDDCIELIFDEMDDFDQEPEYKLYVYPSKTAKKNKKIRDQIFGIENKLTLIRYLLEE